MRHDELLLELGGILGLTEDDDPAWLIGGVAVALRNEAIGTTDEYSDWRDSPATLASIPRSTVDLDLVLSNPNVLKERLIQAGFVPDLKEPVRLRRGATSVDLLPRDSAADSISVPAQLCSGGIVEVGGHSVRVPEKAALVVLKALAFQDRHSEKDLTDIASLALGSFNSVDEIRHRISSLSKGIAGAERALETVADRFRSEDARGPGLFFQLAREALGISRFDEGDDEALVRSMAYEAVSTLLRDFRR